MGKYQTDGTQVFPELSSKVIEKLLLNVPLGSLSFIPVSGQTIRDEFPHKIFKHFPRKAKNRYASSCRRQLGRFFFKWNKRKENLMINVGISVELLLPVQSLLFSNNRDIWSKKLIIWKVEYGSYQVGNESKIMSIAK